MFCQNQEMECFMKKKYSFFDEDEEAYKIEAFVSFGVSRRLSHFLLEGH